MLSLLFAGALFFCFWVFLYFSAVIARGVEWQTPRKLSFIKNGWGAKRFLLLDNVNEQERKIQEVYKLCYILKLNIAHTLVYDDGVEFVFTRVVSTADQEKLNNLYKV